LFAGKEKIRCQGKPVKSVSWLGRKIGVTRRLEARPVRFDAGDLSENGNEPCGAP